jgi:hypothetical protein
VTTESEAPRKRALFETWVEAHRGMSAPLALAGEAIDRRQFLARVSSLTGRQGDDDYVCLLLERRPSEETPAYLGRSERPVRRWMEHLHGLARGEGVYARWRTRLLREGHETARFDLELLVVGETRLLFPPLPGSPATTAAAEQQLLGLVADAYPLRLLSHGDH